MQYGSKDAKIISLYLTPTEAQKVEEQAAKWDIDGTAEDLVAEAMQAVLFGEADEAAYSVTDAANVEWLFYGCWFRRRPNMNAELARAILAQGKKDGTHEQPIPEDDTKAIADAEELVQMATTAWNQHVRGPEVEVLLKMAASENGGGSPPPEEEKPEPEQKAPEPTPEPQQQERPETQEGDDLSQIEPWEGYVSDGVQAIIAGINEGLKEYEPSEFRELMGHVWAYEQEHKNRSTILDHLEKVAAKLEKMVETEAPPKEPEPEPEGPEEEPPGPEPDPVEAPTPEPEVERDDTAIETEESSGEVEGKVEIDAPTEEKQPEAEQPQEKPESKLEKEEDKPRRGQKKFQEVPEDSDEDYRDLMQMISKQLEEDRVHKPSLPDEEVPELPWDWTKMSDADLQRFHGMFSAIAYYKNYVLAREERMAIACRMAADELHNTLLTKLPKYDERDKEKRIALIEAEVEDDENVKKWRRRQRKHETFAASHRNERDSIGKLVDALSRHETLRHDEWERSGKLQNRPSGNRR